jgi:tRNA modification GTPase
MEIVVFELQNGLDALGEIIGETTSDQVLDVIFGQFCIGK